VIPLVDLHCHLLAGLDDGPRDREAALAMCRLACEQGTRMVAATAHQNPRYPENSPERIRSATRELAESLRAENLPLQVFPSAEVMAQPDLLDSFEAGELLGVGGQPGYLLVEMPDGACVDIGYLVERLSSQGVRPILAHPERHEEVLHTPGVIEELIASGCLVQVSSASITHPRSLAERRALRGWLRRGIVHLIGSDGHSVRRRPPLLAAAYAEIVRCVGTSAADRICSTNGMAVLQGLPIRTSAPKPLRRSWLMSWWS